MTVHILAPDDHVFSLNRVSASIGFKALGEEVRYFEREEFPDLSLEADDIVVGGVGFAQDGMRKLGLEVPLLDSIPEPLSKYAGRTSWHSTMGEVRKTVSAGRAVFAKPVPHRLKAFNGQLYSSFGDLIGSAHVSDDEEVECSDPIDLVSEYRCYVRHGDVMDLRPYKGNPMVFPDASIIENALKDYDQAPAGYALDFGVTRRGETVVVEVNDGYAIGAYGLAPIKYANIILARWQEIRSGK